MFKANSYLFIPDEHAFVESIELDAATSLLYGDKLYIYGDLMISHDQVEHLNGFNSIIVDGTATMPITAAGAFKVCGKANDYELYEGILLSVNGTESIGHEQLQTAIRLGIRYTLKVNGKMTFLEDVTAEDIDAIAAVHCNGIIYAPGSVRSALDTKMKVLNGKIINLECEESEDEEQNEQAENTVTTINAGNYRL